MTIEELKELIEKVGKDKLPLNVFTIEDDDPHVLLGKMLIIEKALKEYHEIADNNIKETNEAVELANRANAKSDEAIETANRAVSGVGSNPNLLINGNFRVNQRGQTNYVGTGNRQYTIDRFSINGTDEFNVGTKTWTSKTQYNGFVQELELDLADLKGKTVTISTNVLNVSGSGLFGLLIRDGTNHRNTITSTGFSSFTYTISPDATQLRFGLIYLGTGTGTISIDYIKLEIGSVATAFSPRPYAEELAMCQRYYLPLINGASVYNGFIFTETNARFSVHVPTTMRLRTPTAELKVNDISKCIIYSNGSQLKPTALVYAGFVDSNQFVINATIPNTSPNHTCAMRLLASASLDAEIY